MQIFIVYISLCSWNVWKTLLSLKNFVFIYMHTIIVTWEKAMAPHSSTLAWKTPWTEESGRLQSMGSLRVGHDWATSLSLSYIGEGNGNPLQCSCLENPRDRGAWWAAVCGVTQSQTRLKQLSSTSSIVTGIIFKNKLVVFLPLGLTHDCYLTV